MIEVLKSLAAILNELHCLLGMLTGKLGLTLNDKQLHFWVFGFCGLGLFLATDMVFKRIAKWSISALSFVYALTLVTILALSVEIQQRLTQQGAMQFSDILAGLWGFLALLGLYGLANSLVRWAIHKKGKNGEKA